MPDRLRTFLLAEPADVPARTRQETLAEALQVAFRTTAEGPFRLVRRYLDTFDGRVEAAGGVLFVETPAPPHRDGPAFILRWETHTPPAPQHSLPVESVPERAGDLPPGPFRTALATVIAPRILLPVFEVARTARRLEVRNPAGKVVARLLIAGPGTVRAPDTDQTATLPGLVWLFPVKGYPKATRALLRFLREWEHLTETEAHEFELARAALGRLPRRAVQPGAGLEPGERADRAVRRLLGHLLDTLRANEPGLRDGRDPEFLHDYRVALRRTRTVLGQLKRLFPSEALATFRAEFKWLGQITGSVRDLDVYLLRMDAYRSHLPARIQPDLDPLAAFLERRRREAHATLVAALDSPRYTALMHDWRTFLEAPVPEPPPTPEAGAPIRDVAARRIWRAYRRVLKKGRAVTPASPPETLHALRIACKKLRYLLEIFHPLFPSKPVKRLVRDLKALQDVLGEHQDFAVQQETLQTFARQMAAEGTAPAETLTAMGRLEAHLADRQRQAREAFAACFDRFTRRKNRDRFTRLFRPAS